MEDRAQGTVPRGQRVPMACAGVAHRSQDDSMRHLRRLSDETVPRSDVGFGEGLCEQRGDHQGGELLSQHGAAEPSWRPGPGHTGTGEPGV